MVRRVGFGGDQEPRKSEDRRRSTASSDQGNGRKGGTRLFVGGFIILWLIAWSAAIAMAVSEIVDQGVGAAETFLFIWVGVAALFWLLAVNLLWRILTGRPLSNRKRRNWGRAPRNHGGVRRGDWDPGEND